MLAEIEDEEGRLFAEFEAKLKEQRQKKLANLLKPLQSKRETVMENIRAANEELLDIDKQIATLTGTKIRKAKASGGKRMKKTEKVMWQGKVLEFIRANKSGVSAAQILEETKLDKPQINNMLATLKKLGEVEGKGGKRDMRYFAKK